MYAATKFTTAIEPARGTPRMKAPSPTTMPLNAAIAVTPAK
jgi:hypothetical protein